MRRWIFPCLVGIVFAGTGCRERARVTKVSSAALVLPSGFVEEALCTPGALEPNGTVTDRTPRLVWRRVQGADAYEVMVNDARQQGTLVRSFTPAQVGCSTGPRCSFTIAAPLALGTASFQVRARNPVAGLRAWSKLASFTVTQDGQPPPSGSNLAVLGTPIVSVTAPGGGGSNDIAIIRDGVKPAVNSTSDEQQYDTYHGTAPSSAEWVGYTFGASHAGDGIRLYGAPGGSADFISIAELEVYAQSVTP